MLQRLLSVVWHDQVLRTSPSSGQASIGSASIAAASCLPLRGSVRHLERDFNIKIVGSKDMLRLTAFIAVCM